MTTNTAAATTRTFPPRSYTAQPFDKATDDQARCFGMTPWDANRWLLTFALDRPDTNDGWQEATLVEGRRIKIRRADCGAGCRCAAEFAFIAS